MTVSGLRDQLGLHADALILRETRGNLLTSNIANAATPHYKARDLDFEAEMARAAGNASLRTSDSRHLAMGGPAASGEALYRDPVTPSLDGNTVEMAVEQMEFSENTLRYQTSLALLNRRISGLMTAIKGE
ncbi:flagellar basal body rod protein FlgB [Cereibacter sphaeroides]|uniref:flagellar basal body rod protein FlgB n=1 Tax=Rhodobacterales TaxID=204455 RepID=UPI000BBE2333|nr:MULTISPECIES: flagellar basal body rod protein FlgB [Paracoccaceae]MCE6953014.1 flagellar basal body rod protein FlgB [Cereibacter sphaeroides]MCE6961888.1 flagellar basal body rod protein FlgB [Cereibacter sphaeroides]MCE6970663.1 flagellar basal body rod protein FlgB [Cereibacter sphaeroides]MCE6975741.1 flagellar basal body rod protein FlgB [Cereibacter sphaeroides]